MGPRRTFRNSFDIPGDDAGPRDEGITIVWRSFRMGAQVPYVFTLTTTIPASAQEIYDAWLDSLTHSEMTRSEASMSDEVGAEVSAWDGYISVCTACIHPRSDQCSNP
jgi:hypothetical protein